MIVRAYATAETVRLFEGASSRLLVRQQDGVGHALYETRLDGGATAEAKAPPVPEWRGQAHYCLSGEGVASLAGRDVALAPGRVVAATGAGACAIEAARDLRLVSIYGAAAREGVFVVSSLAEIEGTERDVYWGAGYSKRLLVRRDGLGFALCVTIGHAGRDSPLRYRNHFESCYYVAGSGEYVWDDGRRAIETADGAATVFVMDRHDAHRMVIREESVCLSVFTPPIEGFEAHDFSRAEASSY